MEFNKELIFAFLLVLFLWWLVSSNNENFNANGTEFVPLNYERYGLRGDLLKRSSIDRLFYPPNRNVRLHQTSNWMYQGYPDDKSITGCPKVPCPVNTNEYDPDDTCYQCSDMKQVRTKIPYIHPH
jgi:hypothetical protein